MVFKRLVSSIINQKRAWLFFLLVVIVSLVYAFSLAPDYTWAHWGSDAGDLIASVYTLGIPHPPGTPAYIILAQPFRLIPFGSPAFKMNLASAVFAILAIIILSDLVYRLTLQNRLATLIAGLFLAFSPVFWSQAVITEVYTLHVLLTGLVVYFLVLWYLGDSDCCWYLAVFFLGLALTNHTTSAMLIPAVGYLVLSRSGTFFFNKRRLLASIISLALGLSLYLYLPLRARLDPPLNWGNPDSLARFVAHVTAQEYGKMLFYRSPWLVVDAGIKFLNSLVDNFTYLGVLLAATGLALHHRHPRLKTFTFFVFFFQALFIAEYKIPNIETFNLTAFWITSLWIGLGIGVLGQLLAGFRGYLRVRLPTVFLSLEKPKILGGGIFDYRLADLLLILPILFCLAVSGWQAKSNWSAVAVSQDREAVDYGQGVFAVLEPKAIVFTEGDRFSLALDYQRWVVHPGRTDVAVMVNGLYLQDWRLDHYRRLYPGILFPDRPITNDPKEALDDLLEMVALNISDRPIYFTLDYPPPKPKIAYRLVVNGWLLQSEGPIYRVLGRDTDLNSPALNSQIKSK